MATSYEKAKKKPLGEGSRFAAIKAKARAGGAHNPDAVAAAAGIKAHGQKAMTRYAAMGRASGKPGSHGHKLMGGLYKKGK